MDSSTYVKEIEGGWEVKLGAGILPITVTTGDLFEVNNMPAGTFALPAGFAIEAIKKKFNAVAAVNKFLAHAS